MKGFASYILRGPLQATMVTAFSAILPPLAYVSGASLALVTLRQGIKSGVLVLVCSAVILGLIGYFSSVETFPLQAVLMAMMLVWWIQVVIVAAVLRSTRSLGVSILVLGLLCLLGLIAFYTSVGDVVAWWRTILPTILEPILDSSKTVGNRDFDRLIENMASIMTSVMAVTIIFVTMINLFIARWAQSALFNPGGFREEFYALRLDKRLAFITMFCIGFSLFLSGIPGNFVFNILILIVSLYSLQGLAIVYAVMAAKGAHIGWLIALFGFMLFALPYSMFFLSAAGFADNWVNFRARISGKGGPPQPPSESEPGQDND